MGRVEASFKAYRLRLRACICTLLLFALGVMSCQDIRREHLWTMQACSPQGLDSLHALRSSLEIEHVERSYRLEFFLHHTNYCEDMSLDLRLKLYNTSKALVYERDFSVELAKRPGEWLAKGLLYREVPFALPQSLRFVSAGTYTLELFSPKHPSPGGITMIAYRCL